MQQTTPFHPEIREAVRRLCAGFPGEYWRALDRERAYPTAFVQALTREGWLSVLIPEEYGGSGLGAATAVLEEIHRSGCNGGENQWVQFSIARSYVQVSAAALMVDHASALFDAGQPCDTEANMAKMLASEASWYAADQCLQTHGGFEYDIERKFRETRLYQVAPISTNLILSHVATHVLGLPKSF